MKRGFFLAAAILLFSGATLTSASTERWIHVRVENVKGASGDVSLNLPIELASAALASLPADEEHHGKFHLQASVNGADVRAMLDAIGGSPDNVFITMERHNKEVSVAKQGRDLLIKIADKPAVPPHFAETVVIKVPVSVVRALVANNASQLDVGAGIRALASEGDLDVTMNKEKQTVRIWTDTRTD